MRLKRCVIFVSPAVYRTYKDLAASGGTSRSALMHQVLRASYQIAEALATAGQARPRRDGSDPADPESEVLPSRRPPLVDPEAVLSSLEQVAHRTLAQSPTLDQEALRRIVEANAEVLLGVRPSADLLERMIQRVYSQGLDDPPRPVGGYLPPM